MVSEADNTAKKVSDAMVAKHAKRAAYFLSAEVNRYRLKDTVWVEPHHKNVLSWHWQQPSYLPGVILPKTGQDVYVIKVGNNKTVEWDHTQLLPREPDPHGRAVTSEFTADAFHSNNNREEDKYTAERILSDKPDPAHWGDGYTRSDGRVLLRRGTSVNVQAALCGGTRPYGWITSMPRTSVWMSRTCWYIWSRATELQTIT